MASARPGVHIIKLKKVCVPPYMTEKPLRDNEFTFIKWHEETGLVYPVNLRVDSNGYYIYYENINKEVEFIDTLMIKDTRVGRFAKAVKDPKIKSQILNLTGLSEVNNNNYFTIVTGLDFVNLNYINFYCLSTDLNEKWASEILSISLNILQVNNSTISFLLKIYTKIILSVSSINNNKLLMKNIIKIFTSNKDERKRVEKALDSCGLPTGKNDTIDITQFNFDLFIQFYKNLTHRVEVEGVFNIWSNNNKLGLMSSEQFMNFINNEQRDPRLNEILYPYLTVGKANELITIYEPNVNHSKKNMLSLNGFMNYLLSDDNNIISMERFDLIEDDMNYPLNHYFINSSHNTYLTGHQLTGKSSVEMYRESLLAGCRCIELDFWNGETDEPIIMHGYTLVPKISAREVIEAIAECAFKTSKYPVILSFENHCNPRQQAKIAKYCYDYFGDMLLNKALDTYPLHPGQPLPPPSALINRIIIKNKKKHHHHGNAVKKGPPKKTSSVDKKEKDEGSGGGEAGEDAADDESSGLKKADSEQENSELNDENLSTSNSDSSSEDDVEDEAVLHGQSNESDITKSDKGTAGKESEAGAEISALVNYVQPVHFYSFDIAMHKNKSYEMSSFDENQAMKLLKERPKEFVNYNKFQLTRVYPKGTRVDSTNFMPHLFWNAGCQLVALNYQTMDLPMQINLAIFEQNHRAGFILKPECMRRNDRDFDPFAENTVDGIIAGSLEIKVISGQFLSDKRVGTYIEVEMYGLPTDTVKKNKEYRTKVVPLNGINPIYDEEPFIFKKIVLPNLAYLRIVAYEESSKIIGHRVLPIIGLRPGYRHITLRSEGGIPLILPTLFLKIRVKDFVPDSLSDLAEALSNPIRYQNEVEKREKQMSILQDDMEGTPDVLHRNKSIVKKLEDVYPSSPPKHAHSSPLKKNSFETNPGWQGGGSITGLKEDLVVGIGLGLSGLPPISGSGSGGIGSSGQPTATAASTQLQTIMDNTYYKNEYVNKGEVDSFEKFWNQKSIVEKRGELDKKIDGLKKRHEKGEKPGNSKTHSKLMKRFSSKNLETSMHKGVVGGEQQDNIYYQQLVIEKCTLEDGYTDLFTALENVIKSSQQKQLKLINNLEIKDISNIMTNISHIRKNEFKLLTSKKYKDKSELDRLKREIGNSIVEKGVADRAAMSDTYAKYKNDCQILYNGIMSEFNSFKKKKFEEINEEFERNKKNIPKA